MKIKEIHTTRYFMMIALKTTKLIEHRLQSLILIGILIFPFPWHQIHAQAIQQFGLNDAMRYAVEHSTAVKKAQLEANRADSKTKEYLSSGLPQVNLHTQFVYNPTLQVLFFPNFLEGKPEEISPITVGTHWGIQGELELNQMAYDPVFKVGMKAVRNAEELNELLVEKSKEDILLNVAQLYYAVQMIDQQSRFIHANRKQAVTLLELTQTQVKNGLARPMDADQLRVNIANLDTQLRNLVLEKERQENLLKLAMQMPVEQEIKLTDTLEEGKFILPDLTAVSPGYLRKVTFAILDKQMTLNELNLIRYQNSGLPRVNLFAGLNWAAQPVAFNDFFRSRSWADYSTVGLRFQIPIFDGYLRRSQVEQVHIDIATATEERRYTEQFFQVQYQNARHKLQTHLNSLESLRANRMLAEEVYRVASQRYQQGITTVAEPLMAETSMREAQVNYILALYQIKLAELELLQINGDLIKLIH